MPNIFYRKWFVSLLIVGIVSGPYVAYAEELGTSTASVAQSVVTPHALPVTVSNHVVLSADQSPYVISDDQGLTISPEGYLDIEPGVTILMGNQPVVVHGELSVKGSVSEPVRFISSVPDFKKRGILIESDATIHEMNNIILEDSSDGIIVTSYQKPSGIIFDGVNIKNSFKGITLVQSPAVIKNSVAENAPLVETKNTRNVKVTDSHIKNIDGQFPIYFSDAQGEIKNVTFEHIVNSNAIYVVNSTTTISDIDALSNDGSSNGISVKTSNINISSSTFSGFDTALRIDQSKAFVEGVHFFQNINAVHVVRTGGVVLSFLNKTFNALQDIVLGTSKSAYAQTSGVSTTTADVIITHSQFTQNSEHGILNESSKLVDARENSWGSETGPKHVQNISGAGDAIQGDVLFDPWIGKTSSAPCCSNVLFIPGVQASRLYSKGFLLGENQLWEPNRNADVEKIYLDAKGRSVRSGIYTRDVINTTNIAGGSGLDIDIYKGFTEHMNALVSSSSLNRFDILPYDWRFAPETIAKNSTSLGTTTYTFLQKIRESASSSKTGKVTLVAHSYGGLVLKSILDNIKNNSADVALIDNIIFVATPQLGAPKAIASILYGDDQQIGKGLILSKTTAQKLAQNSPSAYALLPHTTFGTSPLISVDPSVTKPLFPGVAQGGRILSRAALDTFMKDMAPLTDGFAGNINEELLASSTKNISALNAWSVPFGITAYQIGGKGLETPRGLYYEAHSTCTPDERGSCQVTKEIDHHPLLNTNGDGTVPLESALKLPVNSYTVALDALNKEYNSNFSHADIVSSNDVTSIIDRILTRATSTISSAQIAFSPTGYIPSSQTFSDATVSNKIEISVHSPVNIMVTDTSGRKTGAYEIPNSDLKGVLQEIPNSSYQEIGEGKYVTLSREEIKSINVVGTDYGSFTLRMVPLSENNSGELITATSTIREFKDVPVSPQTAAYIDWNTQVTSSSTNNSGLPQTLLVDFNHDGQYEGAYDATPLHIGTSSSASSTNQTRYTRMYKLLIAYLRHIMQSIHFPLSNVIKNILEQKIRNIELRLNQGVLPKTEKIKNQLAYLTDVIASAKAKKHTLTLTEMLSVTDKLTRLLSNI